jgi:hypothetical protein
VSAYSIRSVAEDHLNVDHLRFRKRRIRNLIATSGLKVGSDIVEAYCQWFVGSDYGWRSEWSRGGYSADPRPRRFSTSQLADHLAGASSAGGRIYSLHTQCKRTQFDGRCFRWSRYIALDLDDKRTATQPLQDRYEACIELLGTPLVLRSPSRGLHLYWPLLHPLSVFGLTTSGPKNGPCLLADLLASVGLRVAGGNVEVCPSPKQTLRLPLGGTSIQLDPVTLKPLALSNRADQLTQLVKTMEDLPRVDPRALANNLSPVQKDPSTTGRIVMPKVPWCTALPSVDRLLTKGLYEGVTRHQAALALTRHWLLVEDLDMQSTTERLLEWTSLHTNGLSKEAHDIDNPTTYNRLRREYKRMCKNLLTAVSSGRFDPARIRKAKAFLTAREADLVLEAGDTELSPKDRYWKEAFAFRVIGFAKRYGSKPHGGATVAVQLSARMMAEWPRCAGGRYKNPLAWTLEKGLLTETKKYRPPTKRAPGRATTFAVLVDVQGQPAMHIDPTALVRATEALRVRGSVRMHPQDIEHALVVQQRYSESIASRYGRVASRRIRKLVLAYEAEMTKIATLRDAA